MKRVIIFAFFIFPLLSFAGEDTGWVNVEQVGGQGGVMFIVISKSVGQTLGCPSTTLRFPPSAFAGDDQASARLYSAALSAMVRKSQIKLYLSHCYSGSYPYYEGGNGFWFAN